jgi:molybdopterin synthase catalytic subunit
MQDRGYFAEKPDTGGTPMPRFLNCAILIESQFAAHFHPATIFFMQDDWIALSERPLNAAVAISHVSDERAGGIAVFIGTTRAEGSPAPHALVALDYEAYPEMAGPQLRDIGSRARARWPILKLAILHRTGTVGLAEPSVVIAVSTPHRAQAFEACRWVIDTLKSEAAIWKKEIWSDRSATWVEAGK